MGLLYKNIQNQEDPSILRSTILSIQDFSSPLSFELGSSRQERKRLDPTSLRIECPEVRRSFASSSSDEGGLEDGTKGDFANHH